MNLEKIPINLIHHYLSTISQDDLGLCLSTVQQDDSDLTFGYVRHVVVGGLGDHELLLDDEPPPLLPALLPHLLQEVLVPGDVARHYPESEPIISEN